MMTRWPAIFGIVVALAGCTSSPPPKDSPAFTGKATPDHAVASDPCAARLHDISGAILFYHAVNKRLPDKLEELTAIADQPLDFSCPLSRNPYVYVPNGLETMGRDKQIILHDASPIHQGRRWCVLMAPPSRPGAALSVEVLLIPEPIFRSYLPTQN